MSSLLLAEHRGYLADASRLRAFEQAIKNVVSPDDAVLDLGSGTGVLGLLALRAGARHVYAVDGSAMANVTRSILRANGGADRATVLRAHSQRVELPEPVDVVVADQLGAFGVEAGAFEAFADARRRHLRPGGTLVPGRIDLSVAPVESTEAWSDVGFWDEPRSGIDISPVGRLARNVRYFTSVGADDLLGAPGVVASADPGDPCAMPARGTVVLGIERAGTLHGLAGWFDAHLAPGIAITNGPLAPDRVARSHVFLPVDEPVAVAPGHRVQAEVLADPRTDLHRWSVVVRTQAGEVVARSAHSSLEGIPLGREDLARARPDATPRLSPSGEARRTVLTMCDGARTRRDIEAAVAERHGDLLPDAAAAAAFVDRVLGSDAS